METGARATGMAGWARERGLGDGVSGRRVATVKAPSAYTQTTAHSGPVPQPQDSTLRTPAKIMPGGARCAILIASDANIKNRRK